MRKILIIILLLIGTITMAQNTFPTTGNVGIGITTPLAPLHFGGSTNKSIRINSATNNAAYFGAWQDQAIISVNRGASDGSFTDVTKAGASIQLEGLTSGSNIQFYTTPTINILQTERMRILANGNVGIGLVNPSALLQIKQTGVNGNIMFGFGGTSATYIDQDEFYVRSGDGLNSKIYSTNGANFIYGYSTFVPYATSVASGYLRIGPGSATTTGFLEFFKANNIRNGYLGFDNNNMAYVAENGSRHIFTGGNVGIATTAPLNPLHVFDATKSQILASGYSSFSTTQSSSNGEIAIGATPTFQGLISYNGQTNANLTFRNTYNVSDNLNGGFNFVNGANLNLFRISSNGNIGIGNINPLSTLSFGTGTSGIGFYSANTTINQGKIAEILPNEGGTGFGDLIFRTYQGGSGGGERMRILNNGNIGIGNTAPVEKLQINGNTRIDGNLYVNGNGSTLSFISFFPGRSSQNQNFNGFKFSNSSGWTEWKGYHNAIQINNVGFFDINKAASNSDSVSSTNMFRVSASTGNVGIATASPRSRLEINSGVTGKSGLQFTNMNALSTASGPNGKNLSVNDLGEVILVNNTQSNTNLDSIIVKNIYTNFGNTNVGLKIEQGDSSPNAGFLRFGDNSGWKLNIGRRKESPASGQNTGSVGTIMTIQDNGNIGIGTTTPNQKLEVNGGITASGQVALNSTIHGTSIGTQSTFPTVIHRNGFAGTDSKIWDTYVNNTSLISRVINDASNVAQVWQEVNRTGATISSVNFPNGNVGIGTANPSSKLHVVGNSTLSGANVKQTFDWSGIAAFSTGIIGTTSADSRFSISTNSAGEALSVNYINGNVGIGTTNPSSKMHVIGNSTFYGNNGFYTTKIGATASGDSYLHLGSRNGVPALQGANNAFTSMQNLTLQYEGGNVGIGTINPSNKLEITGSLNSSGLRFTNLKSTTTVSPSNNRALSVDANGDVILINASTATTNPIDSTVRKNIYFQSEGGSILASQKLSVLNNGNVGIGTTNPLQRQHNNISVGGVGIGLMLSNDATNATIGRGTGILFAGTGNANLAQIESQTLNASNNTGGLIFRTANAGTLTERLRIDQNGSVGLGTTGLTGFNLRVSKPLTGNGGNTAYGVVSDGIIQSDITTAGRYFYTTGQTATNTTLSHLVHYETWQGTFGDGSVVSNQTGFWAREALIGATNNYGFRGNIPSGTNRWNLFMDGMANNHMAGSLGIGTTTLTGYNLRVSKNITGAASVFGVSQIGSNVGADATTQALGYYTGIGVVASASIPNLFHYVAGAGSFNSSTVSNQTGFFADGSLIGATANYGFRGNIPSGTNRWNLFMDGTAQNHFRGNVGIGLNSTVPATELEVRGQISVNAGTLSNPALSPVGDLNTGVLFPSADNMALVTGGENRFHVNSNGNVGIGTVTPNQKLHVAGYGQFDSGIIGNSAGLVIYGSPNSLPTNGVFLTAGGALGIGVQNGSFPAGYKLAVDGNIIAEKVKVKNSNAWPDFVFEPQYKLPDLLQIESYVKENKHLPDIPSAAEVEKDGQDLGEMNRLLLKKVEELTLYMIEMKKENQALKQRVEKLEK